ncbi:hypothetical protein DEU38_103139 [Rhodococcus sp. AG1013]|uniref:hypothetical protein n=1 Tax=Rhodococcus sp. AG1013 TaxID=2183996 RepID=UPI000E0A5779|nr:hypothetical protein [Rhodococcus sp. AG1013]RDI32406.1 hypothetical protein DEU38_103139 [Rhodococcus sp. AG1013]
MTHAGTYDFAPETAPLDDRILGTVEEFRCDCRSAAWDRTIAFFWAVSVGVTIGTVAWWGVVSVG